jgi:homospermidine synthase
MDVAYAASLDPSQRNGPTPLQVTGGVWVSLQYILKFPNSGDCFPEDVPSDFVMENAFPYAGTLITKPCPEALKVTGFFDPSVFQIA